MKHIVSLPTKIETKAYFDHHKGMFGALAVLKHVAANLAFDSIELFEKVKVFFFHAESKTIIP